MERLLERQFEKQRTWPCTLPRGESGRKRERDCVLRAQAKLKVVFTDLPHHHLVSLPDLALLKALHRMSLPPLFIDIPRNPILAVGIPVVLGE